MERQEFSQIRHRLERTQQGLARLLGVSLKTVQSFEHGRRRVPLHVEREMLLLLSLKTAAAGTARPCWETIECPEDWRNDCIVWELQVPHFCWYLNGTSCQGTTLRNWREKIELCRRCDVYLASFETA